MQTTQNQPKSEKKDGLFLFLLVLTFFLILAEISFSIECSGMYFGDFKLIANHLSVPWHVVLAGVIYFIAAQLLLHLVFILMIWSIARLAGLALNWSRKIIEKMGIALWFVGLIVVLFANRLMYPNSKFATVLLGNLQTNIVQIVLVALSIMILSCVLLAIAGLGVLMMHRTKRMMVAVAFTLGLTTIAGFSLHHKHNLTDAASLVQPNIIIIGIDSVRPDYLGFFGSSNRTPHLDDFLNHATVFSEAMTPIARTYPSWVSILTGVYPKLNTIRTNLADQHNLDVSQMLPMELRQQGYKTIFATDETRFSNIDQHYGFDEVVTPPIGFNDFLLGSMNDFPFSNLVLNTPIGRHLFPYSYGNRSVFTTYDPNSFLNLLEPALAEPRTKPLLFITHFCLPHFPYAWASLYVKKVQLNHYQAAIARADQQFNDFMHMLQKNKILDHAIVVVLSDHGEGVERPGDRITDPDLFVAGENNKNKVIPHFYPPSSTNEKVNMSGGHGTDVLGLSQYHTLLAFRTYGIKPNNVAIVPGIVSLMDIKPTLLGFFDLPFGRSSGNSLEKAIFSSEKSVDDVHDFFVESDFSPEAIRSVHPEERKVLFEGIDYFRIDPVTARIVVRDSMLKMIISSKQYADYYGSWVLALYPQTNKLMMPILVSLRTGQWTNDLSSDFAKNSPAKHMLIAMKLFFGNDITTVM